MLQGCNPMQQACNSKAATMCLQPLSHYILWLYTMACSTMHRAAQPAAQPVAPCYYSYYYYYYYYLLAALHLQAATLCLQLCVSLKPYLLWLYSLWLAAPCTVQPSLQPSL